MKLVRRVDADAYYEARKRHAKAKAEFDRLPILEELRQKLASILAALPTKAARHRWLVEHGIETYSYGTFIKHWETADRWVNSGVNQHNVLKVSAALGVDPSLILEHEALVNRLRADCYWHIEVIPTGLRHLEA